MSTDTSGNSNPIIIIDDDLEDLELFEDALKQLGVNNEVILFTDGNKFYDYISTTKTRSFFVLCDINMNQIDGFALKKKIFENEKLRLKCIPFLMLSTSSTVSHVQAAYNLNVQGYFVKPNSFDEIKTMLQAIIQYWSLSQLPLSEQ